MANIYTFLNFVKIPLHMLFIPPLTPSLSITRLINRALEYTLRLAIPVYTGCGPATIGWTYGYMYNATFTACNVVTRLH